MKSRARPKRGYHHGDLKNALVETALRLVGEKGPEGFSLREAARDVGVSPGAAYRHFADKDALMQALAVDGHARLVAHMERALERVPGAAGAVAHAVAAFHAIGQAYVEFAIRHPSHFRVMFRPCEGPAPCETAEPATGRDAYQILVDVMTELVSAHVVAPAAADAGAFIAWAFVHGQASLEVERTVQLSARQRGAVMAAGCRTLLVGLGADPAVLAPLPEMPSLDPRPPELRARLTG